MANLIERLRAAREAWVKVGDAELLVRRPTRLQMGLWQGADPTIPLRESIVGWRGVSEITLGIPGGDGANESNARTAGGPTRAAGFYEALQTGVRVFWVMSAHVHSLGVRICSGSGLGSCVRGQVFHFEISDTCKLPEV